MSRADEQSKWIEDAYLLLSSPEVVFQELKARSKEICKDGLFGSRSETLELMLVERGVPLINLGLACYGADKTAFKGLYKHGREANLDRNDEAYRRGLRMGCLSNVTVAAAHFLFDFPRELIGEGELLHVLAEADFLEAEALICNPAVSDRLLEQLYKREVPFAKLTDERLCNLVSCSRKNARINTNEDDNESPDLGHYRIHNAILELVETAPVNARWMSTLYHLLDTLNPGYVAHTERLEAILARWKPVEGKSYDGSVRAGLLVDSITYTDEFRSLIAGLYGASLKGDQLESASKSEDVAMRAAYYANGNLTVKDIETGFERDKNLFVYSAMHNGNIIINVEKRQLFESLLSDGMIQRYGKFVNFSRERYRSFFRENPSDLIEDVAIETADTSSLEHIVTAINALDKKVDVVVARFQQFQSYFIVAAIAAAIAFYFRK
ncbi:hypothetical protein ACO2JO_18455 [Leptospira interrogans]